MERTNYKNFLHFTVYVFLLFFTGALLSFHPIYAQEAPPRVNEGDVSLKVNPVSPDANSDVTANLESFAIDLDVHYIEWFVDGKSVARGFGEKNITTKTKDYGRTTLIEAHITTQEGTILKKTLALRPARVDILWEAVNSYTPPFYKGKALPTLGAVIKFSAIPQSISKNELESPYQFDYTWEWNNRVSGEASGFGKNYMAIQNNLLNKAEKIGVTARSLSGNFSAYNTIQIPILEPELLIYNKNTHSNDLVVRYFTKNRKLELEAAPFYFSTTTNSFKPTGLLYEWKIDGVATNISDESYTLPLELLNSGVLEIDLTVQNKKHLSQREIINTTITFTE